MVAQWQLWPLLWQYGDHYKDMGALAVVKWRLCVWFGWGTPHPKELVHGGPATLSFPSRPKSRLSEEKKLKPTGSGAFLGLV